MRNLLIFSLLLMGFATACQRHFNRIGSEEGSLNPTPVADRTLYGVCRQNFQWLTQAKVAEVAANIDSVNIPLVRLSGVKAGGSIQQVINNINVFAEKDINVLIEQPMWMEMFPEGYEQVPGPNFKVYRMSDIDTARFRSFITQLVSSIASNTPDSAVVGIELFNEANWGDFNGDLQPAANGKGELFTLDTPLTKPAFAPIYNGISKYGKCLQITRQVLNQYFPMQNVKLISTGLAAGAPWNNYSWLINRGISLAIPDLFLTLLQGNHPNQSDTTNYLQFVDGIGLHCYPPLQTNMINTMNQYFFNPINAVLDISKPYWITEWGFGRQQFTNIGGEATRLEYINRFTHAIDSIGNVQATTFYEFDASSDHNIWENGALLLSGTFFQTVNNQN